MLVLTRKSNESVILGDGIEVRVLSVRGDQVSLGFSAPPDMRIHRKEVFEAIQAENRMAAGASGSSLSGLKGFLEVPKK